MIDIGEDIICKGCGTRQDLLTEEGYCKNCTQSKTIPMYCRDCEYGWNQPGQGAWCPSCGSMNVTSRDKIIDTWMWQREAEKLGIKFAGMQNCGSDIPEFPVFQDNQTGSFCLGKGETVKQALERKRREFKK